MNSRREAKKILKTYGKALYRSRVEYVDSFTEVKRPLIRTVSYRRLMKRSMVIILVLIMVFSLLVIGANALGIKFLNLSFIEKEDHTSVTTENTGDGHESGQGFYKPGYIPEGFTLVETDEFEGVDVTYSYANDNDEFLYIAQSKADNFSMSINNEDCEIRQDTIEDMEAKIYTYHDTKKILILIEKENIYIQISGPITEDEARKIVRDLS